MKKNPRREVTPEEQSQIRAMTLRGDSQILISRTLKIGRDTVGAWQVKLGVSAPVVPIPEAEILKLAKAGHGVYKIRAVTGVSVKKISAIVNKHGIIHPGRNLTPEKRAKIDREIRSKKFYLASIARRNRVTEQTVQARAHRIFGRARFRPGVSWPPLSSDFPQSHFPKGIVTFEQLAQAILAKLPTISVKVPEELTTAVMEATPEFERIPLEKRELFRTCLISALRIQILADAQAECERLSRLNASATAWVN